MSTQITTVNCVPVLRRDHEATDGLVHLLDGILSPASTTSLPQLLMEDGRFREMARLMLRSEALVAQLRREPGPFTLLAPSDEAFQAMPPGQLQRISQDLNVTTGKKNDLGWPVNCTKSNTTLGNQNLCFSISTSSR